jgi:hypothetical protein
MILRWLQQRDDSRIVVYDINLTPYKLIANINAGMQGGRTINYEWFANKSDLRRGTMDDLINELVRA